MYRILIVEDDAVIAEAVRRECEGWGFEALCVLDFSNVLAEFTAFAPQLVVLDISLPFFNGYHWCSEIRKISRVPILFLSSASDNMNIVLAMNMGGDDFLPKPFDLSILTAKIQALLRRAYDFSADAPMLTCGGAVLDTGSQALTYRGQTADLTRNEFRILQLLMERKGRVVSRETLMTRLWESDSYIDDNTLTVNINRLRRKLSDIGLSDLIATKKGQGYIVGGPQCC
ncbi:MAG: response regulator transcription factor [Clostridiaceae bacterium]|nr:response regulator transcription factor [Clostridiaceae bacterium]